MDIERKGIAARKKKRRVVIFSVALVAVAAIGFGFSQLDAPVYKVDADSIWLETVEKGELLREVSGIGTLVPKSPRLITARSSGIVEELVVFPGTEVDVDTVILRMSNPQLILDAESARFDLLASKADFEGLKIQLQGTLLEMESRLTQLKASNKQARLQADVNAKLFEQGLVAELTYLESQMNAEQLEERVALEEKRYNFQVNANKSRLDTQGVYLQNLEGRYQLLGEQVARLDVTAGSKGVLQSLLVEEGQQVSAGTLLAQAADPKQLKGVIQISETQAKDITLGQPATIDTRNGIVNGRVIRIDPAVVRGTVAVDVELLDTLPRGARPDLTVEGRIELENLSDVVFVARPAFSRENSTIGIFKVESGGELATRTPVEFGKSSVSVIEIISGLSPGDQIITTDTSKFEEYDTIRIQ